MYKKQHKNEPKRRFRGGRDLEYLERGGEVQKEDFLLFLWGGGGPSVNALFLSAASGGYRRQVTRASSVVSVSHDGSQDREVAALWRAR